MPRSKIVAINFSIFLVFGIVLAIKIADSAEGEATSARYEVLDLKYEVDRLERRLQDVERSQRNF